MSGTLSDSTLADRVAALMSENDQMQRSYELSAEIRENKIKKLVADLLSGEQMYLAMRDRCARVEAELDSLKKLLDTPETEDFDKAVPLEAAHQVAVKKVEA